MLNTKINDLENKIKTLDDIKGFKSSITAHNKIQKELEQLKLEVENLEKFVNTDTSDKPIEQITDEQYVEYLNEIISLNEVFDKLEVNEQIQVYQNMTMKIKLCDSYLKSRKMEIVYVDANKANNVNKENNVDKVDKVDKK